MNTDGPGGTVDAGTASTSGADATPGTAPAPVTFTLRNEGSDSIALVVGQDGSLCPSLAHSVILRTTDDEGAVVLPVADCITYCGDEPIPCELAPCDRLTAISVAAGESFSTRWTAEAEVDTADGCIARALQTVGATYDVTFCWATEVDDDGPTLVEPTCATKRFMLDDEPIEVVLSTDDAA